MFRLILFLSALLLGTAAAATQSLYVNAPDDGFLNLRSGPSTAYRVIRQMPHGDTVTVLSTPGKWYKVLHRSGASGWAHSGWLVQDDPTRAPGYHDGITQLPTLYVHAPGHGALNLRQGPGTEHAVILQMAQASRVEVLGEQGKWLLVRHESGHVGWAHGDYLSSTRQALPRAPHGPALHGHVATKKWRQIIATCQERPGAAFRPCIAWHLRRMQPRGW
ncbi:SH3 domain-containing protein [Pseudoponticoccus marisrubri]|uniref:SH3b domain-containing protein n=1 Tax=Pseudoponticoccus marisrubri TaxID=1685382 RepID=A0A0W7WET3_9RHOB|nr:SH3 domain-containing protein [Pseudoponticoccus marisrubri]KUF09139.1 hypothetical protein AVJ23_18850 [Pseudoponticoccus marisrubri]